MSDRINRELKKIKSGIQTSGNEIAFKFSALPSVLKIVAHNQWVILGGDVLTQEKMYTYDNWYYKPDLNKPLSENVICSIQKASTYISDYVCKHGEAYLFLFVLSDTYVDGKM